MKSELFLKYRTQPAFASLWRGRQGVGCLLLFGMLLCRPCAADLPPLITVPPLSQTVLNYDSATFTVVAVSLTTMTYQWRKDGVNVAGATDGSYTIAHTRSSDEGLYSVQVFNAGGSATSSDATLTVLSPPTITTQPQSKTVNAAQNVSFSVAATGTGPLSYQWRLNGTPLTGASGSSLTVTNVQASDAGNYRAIVWNSYGSATSAVATLTVIVPPMITNQPQSQTVVVGQNASFSVTATGTAPLSYQWRFNG